MKIEHTTKVIGIIALAGSLLIAVPAFAERGSGDEGGGDVEVQVQGQSMTPPVRVEARMQAGTTTMRGEGESSDDSDDGGTPHGILHALFDDHASGTAEMRRNEDRDHGQQGERMREEHASSTEREGHGEDMMEFDRDSAELEGTSTASINDPKMVRDDSDLRAFTKGIFRRDEHVSRIEVSSTSVSARVVTPARLLGLIPVSVPADVSVSGDGKTEVSFPWYALFFTTNQAQIEAGVSTAVQQALGTPAGQQGESGVGLSSTQQAALVHGIVGALQGLFGFGASASATSSASAGTQ